MAYETSHDLAHVSIQPQCLLLLFFLTMLIGISHCHLGNFLQTPRFFYFSSQSLSRSRFLSPIPCASVTCRAVLAISAQYCVYRFVQKAPINAKLKTLLIVSRFSVITCGHNEEAYVPGLLLGSVLHLQQQQPWTKTKLWVT